MWSFACALVLLQAPEVYSLANGLRVVLDEDHAQPQVAIHVRYGTGSAADPPKQPGLAHLVEHLAFGTKHLLDYNAIGTLQDRGAVGVNGITWLDGTSYIALLPGRETEAALWVESDRMGFVDPPSGYSLWHEREVVNQEHEHHDVLGHWPERWREIWRSLFPAGHPYARVRVNDVSTVQVDDIHGFIQRHYVPNNAVLVLVGDLPDDTKALVEKYFGPLAGGIERSRPPVTPAQAREVVQRVVNTKETHVVFAYRLPPRFTRDAAIADVAARLVAKTHAEPTIADAEIEASVGGYALASMFIVSASVKRSIPATSLRGTLEARLVQAHAEADDRRVAGAIRACVTQALRSEQALDARAERYAYEALETGAVADPADRYRDVDGAGVRAFLVHLLGRKGRIERLEEAASP